LLHVRDAQSCGVTQRLPLVLLGNPQKPWVQVPLRQSREVEQKAPSDRAMGPHLPPTHMPASQSRAPPQALPSGRRARPQNPLVQTLLAHSSAAVQTDPSGRPAFAALPGTLVSRAAMKSIAAASASPKPYRRRIRGPRALLTPPPRLERMLTVAPVAAKPATNRQANIALYPAPKCISTGERML
jgi:hypothetical protein